MEIHLAQREHPDRLVQAWGVAPTDPYVEICWSRLVKPRAARLVSCVAELSASGDHTVNGQTLWDTLGEEPATDAMALEMLSSAAINAASHRLGDWARSGEYLDRRRSFEVYRTVPVVSRWDLDHLRDVELAHHVATVRNINERLGADSPYTVALPDWVYWRAGFDSTQTDLSDVRDSLFDRGLPDWPSLRVDEHGSAGSPAVDDPVGLRAVSPDERTQEPYVPAWARPAEHGVHLSPGQRFYSTATGDRFEYLGDSAWRVVGGPHGVPTTLPLGQVVDVDGIPDEWRVIDPDTPSDTPASHHEQNSAKDRDRATEAAQQRLDALAGRRLPSPGLGL